MAPLPLGCVRAVSWIPRAFANALGLHLGVFVEALRRVGSAPFARGIASQSHHLGVLDRVVSRTRTRARTARAAPAHVPRAA